MVGSLALVCFGIWTVPSADGQIQTQDLGRWQNNEQETVAGVYLPTDRSLTRAMGRARERLADHEYHQALEFLHEILGREEDSFLERTEGGRDQLGLKATARQMIGELPPEGHDAHELLYGATARRQLNAALAAGDQDAVAAVVRQFFHTSAGYEAALVLAGMEADQEHHLAAAQLYRELLDTPRAASRFEPQLSLLAAVNQMAAGEPESAATILRSLSERNPAAAMELLGQTVSAPAPGGDPLAWLSRFIGQPLQTARPELNWLTLRGDVARSARNPGGQPHLRARWEARVVNDPSLEAYLSGRGQEFAQRGVVAIPGARPIAVGDIVIMRTPQNVVAVDWRTGKRIWETRDDEELQPHETPPDFAVGIDDEQWAAQGNPLEQRMWDDALAMSLSSDGQRVFVLRGVSVAPREEMMGWQVAPGFGQGIGEATATTNQLATYDLNTQGKLVWELDGGRATGPLAGAFFLGAPLAIDNTLFVMAEIRSAVYLLALDPATGEVQWQQQLVGLEQGIALDLPRRLIGATPSYAGGILVCPTSASAVIAIDVVKREFAWVYRYPREMPSPAEIRNIWQPQAQNQSARINDRWLDSSAVVAEGRVFLTPPESAELHCLDLRSGKLIWKYRQGDALFVGCVDQGHVLLVGGEAVQALRVADGTPAWEQELLPLPSGTLPAGQGYLSDGSYYLPLTSGEIVAVDTATGKLASLIAGKPDVQLGNLICHRGSILSQSALVLDKFEQLDVLRQRAESALANNPDDATALRELAELERADGNAAAAVRRLKRAFELAPNDPLTREMLAEVLLEALAADYATFRDEVPLVAGLVRDREQQIELLRIEAAGLDKLGQRLAAWDAYLRLTDFTAEEPAYLPIDTDYSVRSDRWICGRLGTLWSEASAEEQKAFSAGIAARRPSLADPRTAAELRYYLAHLDQLPGANEVRRELARFLVERGRAQEAELELLELGTAPDQGSQATAAALLTKLSYDTGQPAAAASFAAILAEKYGNVVVLDGMTGQEWLERLQRETTVAAESSPRSWPRGWVDAEVFQAAASGRERGNRAQAERPAGLRQLRIEQDFWPGSSATHWFVAMDCSELVGRNTLGDDVFRFAVDQNNLSRQYRDSNLVHAARLGHLLFVALGGQIMAIDSRRSHQGADGNLLWQTFPSGRMPAGVVRGRRIPWGTRGQTSRRPVYHAWSDRKRTLGAVGAVVGSLGPVTPRGVVYQEQDELKCVDPLSGETLWVRTDVPAGCELFGDRELVFAADVGERVAYVVRTVDGQLVGKRELPKFEWLLTAGRHVAQVGFRTNRESKAMLLRVTDIWSQDVLFDAEFPLATRVSVIEPNAIAVYQPTGKFQWIDVPSGQVVIDQQLQAVANTQSIQMLRSSDELFISINNQPQQQQYKRIAEFDDYSLVSGLVYALSMKTGKPLWPGPAILRNRGMVLSQPEEIPLLVFADRKMIRSENTGGGWQLRLLCLDKRTGQTVYRNDSLPDTSITRFRIRGERDAEPIVSVEMNAGKIQLTMTDRPRPPQPPANDELEATREIAERGLRGIGERMGGVLRGALENRSGVARSPGASNPQRAQPAGDEPAEPLDDD